MELAAEAIRGHKSAHSLATGPVMAEPAVTQCSSESVPYSNDAPFCYHDVPQVYDHDFAL